MNKTPFNPDYLANPQTLNGDIWWNYFDSLPDWARLYINEKGHYTLSEIQRVFSFHRRKNPFKRYPRDLAEYFEWRCDYEESLREEQEKQERYLQSMYAGDRHFSEYHNIQLQIAAAMTIPEKYLGGTKVFVGEYRDDPVPVPPRRTINH